MFGGMQISRLVLRHPARPLVASEYVPVLQMSLLSSHTTHGWDSSRYYLTSPPCLIMKNLHRLTDSVRLQVCRVLYSSCFLFSWLVNLFPRLLNILFLVVSNTLISSYVLFFSLLCSMKSSSTTLSVADSLRYVPFHWKRTCSSIMSNGVNCNILLYARMRHLMHRSGWNAILRRSDALHIDMLFIRRDKRYEYAARLSSIISRSYTLSNDVLPGSGLSYVSWS